MTFRSGNPAVDRYIAEGYATVRGMSSRFAATICGHVIRRQSELGIAGHIAEIGTFEGRFFIAMALGVVAVLYFLPIMVAYNASKKLNVDPWVGATIMAALFTPEFMKLSDVTATPWLCRRSWSDPASSR